MKNAETILKVRIGILIIVCAMVAVLALARLGLARAYAFDATTSSVARDKARNAYEDFLTVWKDADRDVPVLKEAQAEYAKLKQLK
jgi:hypothetical protein